MSGIAVDPADPNHAWISYSGYEAYTPGEPGHVFEARFNPATGTASFTDLMTGSPSPVRDDQLRDLGLVVIRST